MKNSISLFFDKIIIEVINPREVYGHDDSFPYNADVNIYMGNKKMLSFKAFNDGWGGQTNLVSESDYSKDFYDFINQLCKDTFICHCPNMTLYFSLIDVIDFLVYLNIDNKINGIVTKEQFQNFIK